MLAIWSRWMRKWSMTRGNYHKYHPTLLGTMSSNAALNLGGLHSVHTMLKITCLDMPHITMPLLLSFHTHTHTHTLTRAPPFTHILILSDTHLHAHSDIHYMRAQCILTYMYMYFVPCCPCSIPSPISIPTVSIWTCIIIVHNHTIIMVDTKTIFRRKGGLGVGRDYSTW